MFKSFSEKSKAKRGLLAFAKKLNIELSESQISELVHMAGDPMKWGFNEPIVLDSTSKAADTFIEAGIGTELQPITGNAVVGPINSESDSESDSEETEPTFAPASMFGGLAATLGAVASNPAPAASAPRAASRSSYTIEKDRPEQNGIKRPSAGGLCRAVWDEMDHIRESSGAVPTTQQVRDAAAAKNWNVNNAMIEFYQWRKFNGITGRAKKVEAPAEPVQATEAVAA